MTTHQQMRPAAVAKTPASAVLGLVLAVLFWPAGLLLSRRALRRSRLGRAGGGRLAFAGLVLSVLGAVTTVLLLTASVVGVARSGPALTGGQSAACQMEVEGANRALAAYRSAGEAPLTGAASARLAALEGAGYLAAVPDIHGLALDEGGRFVGAC